MAAGANTVSTLKAAIRTRLKTVSGLKIYKYEPRDLDSRPAVTIQTTQIQRRGVFRSGDLDSGEDELGRADFQFTFTLRLYVDLDDPERAETKADGLLGQIIGAFDLDPTLAGTAGVIDTKVLSADYGEVYRDSKPMLGYVLQLGIQQGIS